MKKVLFSLLASLFVFIPTMVFADTTCVYQPLYNFNGENTSYGEYTITRKDNGSFIINGKSYDARGNSFNTGITVEDKPVYFAGKDADFMYNRLDYSKMWTLIDDYCKSFKKAECPSSYDGVSFFKFACEPKVAYCRIAGKEILDLNKKEELTPRGNLEVLKRVFTGDTCPTLNMLFEHDKDLDKFYLVLLSSSEAKTQVLNMPTSGTKTTLVDPTKPDSPSTSEIDVNVIYYSEGKKDNHNYFKKVTYNKDGGYLKFKTTDYYGSKSFTINAVSGQSNTVKVDNPVHFIDTDYEWLEFKIYGNPKTKLDSWKSEDYLYLMFSDGQNGTLTHYLMANTSDVISFCENVWGYEYNQCKEILDNANEKADDDLHPDKKLTKFDIALIPLCADDSGALVVMKLIGYALIVIKILVPIALIIYGSLDFYKAVTSYAEDNVSKATKALIQRAIIGVAVFFIPTIVYYGLSLIGNAVSKDDGYFQNCNTCLFKPGDCKAKKVGEK